MKQPKIKLKYVWKITKDNKVGSWKVNFIL